MSDHAREAESLLTRADDIRNADSWNGDRDAASLAIATAAQAHAMLALVELLQKPIATYDASTI